MFDMQQAGVNSVVHSWLTRVTRAIEAFWGNWRLILQERRMIVGTSSKQSLHVLLASETCDCSHGTSM
jgi:hypothetical protein